MAEIPAQLDYAPAHARRRRRRARLAALIVGGAALVVVLRHWWPALSRHAQTLYWQRQCLAYVAPADQVVYEEDAARARQLRGDGSGVYVNAGLGNPAFVPIAWLRFAANMGWTGQSSGTVFLHERRLPDGTRRLVQVALSVHASPRQGGQRLLTFDARLTEPGHIFAAPIPVTTSMRGRGDSIMLLADDVYRVYAGRVDPNDPARFTIDYELNGKRQTLHGSLFDADRVEFEARDLPELPKRDMKRALEK